MGSSVYAFNSFGLRLLGFALLVVYSRFLAPRDFGIVSLAESVGLAVGIVSGLALESGERRLYFHLVDDEQQLQSYLSTLLRFAAACAALVLVTALLIGPRITTYVAPAWRVGFFPYLALPIFTAIASQLLQCRLAVYQCEERLFAYSGFVALQSLSTTVLTLYLVVWTRHGAVGLLAARAIGAAIALLTAACLSGSILRAPAQWSYVRDTLRLSLPLVPHGLIGFGLIAIDRFILQHYRPLAEVGLYAMAYNIGMIMTMVTAALSRAWTPLFYSLLRGGEEERSAAAKIFEQLLVLLTFVASSGVLLAPVCVHWFLGSSYWPIAKLAPILLGAYLFHSFFALFQLRVIQARRTSLVSMVSGTALATNVVLNLLWVPNFGMVGAAYATLVAYAVESIIMAVVAHRVLPLTHRRARPILALAIFGAALAWTQVQTAVLPSLAFAGLLIAACASRPIRQLWRGRPEIVPGPNEAVEEIV